MAKYLAQVIVTGMEVVGRAFARAVKQELRASQQAAEARQGSQSSKTAAKDALTGMSVQEAKQVLNVSDLENIEEMQKKYEHLFEVNERKKGGSLYLQSKVVRAKERIDQELNEQAQQEAAKKSKSEEL